VTNLKGAVEFMREVNRFGCTFALDDFGSGMSSFTYLKNLPVDFVKIDGSFVENILTDPTSLAMVRAISDRKQRNQGQAARSRYRLCPGVWCCETNIID